MNDGLTFDDLRIGMRIQMHPATDLWMRGARYGWVTHKYSVSGKVRIQLDNYPTRFVVAPHNLIAVTND